MFYENQKQETSYIHLSTKKEIKLNLRNSFGCLTYLLNASKLKPVTFTEQNYQNYLSVVVCIYFR